MTLRSFSRSTTIAWLVAICAVAGAGLLTHRYYGTYQELMQVEQVRAEADRERVQADRGRDLDLSFRNYRRFYGAPGPVALAGLSLDQANARLRLYFVASGPCHVVYGGRELPVEEGRVDVPFSGGRSTSPVRETIEVVSGADRSELTIEYFSAELYASHGIDNPGVLLVRTNLPRTVVPRRNRFDRIEKDRQAMAHVLGGQATLSLAPRERVLAVLRRLADAIDAAPMNRSQLSRLSEGKAILEEIQAGRTYIACSGLSTVGRDYLLAAGIPARRVRLKAPSIEDDSGLIVQPSENHTSSELHLDGRWSWFDLTWLSFYARSGDDPTWLSLWELVQHAQIPRLRQDLVFGVYDPETKTLRELRLAESAALRLAVERFLTSDKVLRFLDEEIAVAFGKSPND